jgi:hypothetical protein
MPQKEMEECPEGKEERAWCWSLSGPRQERVEASNWHIS